MLTNYEKVQKLSDILILLEDKELDLEMALECIQDDIKAIRWELNYAIEQEYV